jgi:hypothetical protein
MANELEHALHAAVNDPEAVGPFYATLLDSPVWIIGKLTDGEPGPDGDVPQGAQVALGHNQLEDGTAYVPFFTSHEVLTEQVGDEAPWLRVNARDLMAMTAGTTLGLNPGTDVGKVMPAELIQELLSATGLSQVEHSADRQMKVGLPQQEPTEIVGALTVLFHTHPQVSAAYYCEVDMDDGSEPHLLVGVDGGEDLQAAVTSASTTAQQFAGEGQVVDFLSIPDDASGLGEYMRLHGVQFVG